MNISLPRVRRIALIALGVAIAALFVALYFANRDAAQATHSPANKVWVSASTLEEMHTQTVPNGTVVNQQPVSQEKEVILGSARARFSNPTDLRISVTAECALWTNTATAGDDDSESKARVELWVTLDGKTVPVAADDPQNGTPAASADPDQQAARGRVVFCNRASRMKTENIETTTIKVPGSNQTLGAADDDTEDDIVIRSYNRTRTANAFNWGALNVGGSTYDSPSNGRNILDIVLHARLATSLTDDEGADNNGTDSPAAKAIVGKRTLFVEPVKMANDASF